jgi:hypothetical protein
MLPFLLIASPCYAAPFLLADTCSRLFSSSGFVNVSGSHWSDCHLTWPAGYTNDGTYDITVYGAAIAMDVEFGILLVTHCTFRNCSACRDGAISFVGLRVQLLRCQGWNFSADMRSFGRFLTRCVPDARVGLEDASVLGGASIRNTFTSGPQSACAAYPAEFSFTRLNVSFAKATDNVASGYRVDVRWNDRLIWQFCTLFSLSGCAPVHYGATTGDLGECSFHAHCITFLNNSITIAPGQVTSSLIATYPTTNATLTCCVFVGNICSAYFGAWVSTQPLYIVIIDCVLDAPRSKWVLGNVTLNSVRERVPIGVNLMDPTCPIGSESFTALVAIYWKRRKILDFWIWNVFVSMK